MKDLLTQDQIREIALNSGFKLKEQNDGSFNLNSYVYYFAQEIARHCWSAYESGVKPHKIHNMYGWIEISDDGYKPQNGQEVLVYYDSYKIGDVVRHCSYINGEFIEIGRETVVTKATHWRPALMYPV